MIKLIKGIVTFRRHVQPGYRKQFAHLALGQKPDTLFIACSDSRVVPNTFASADPGDLFVIRNVGNLIPPAGKAQQAGSDCSEAAAIEFALSLKIKDIIVCGHSDCGAIRTLSKGHPKTQARHLREWLRHGRAALVAYRRGRRLDRSLEFQNTLSQINVLQQIEHLRSYHEVRRRTLTGSLRLHGWWFDIHHADVYAYEPTVDRFVLIDEEEAQRLLARMRPGRPASTKK